jgi:hypothetical protein
MGTQKFMGRGQLLKRLTAQVGGDKKMARNILVKRGDMRANGTLTSEGRKRNDMTAEERAKDRAAKRTGKPASSFKYNPKTNTATRK